MHPKAGQMVSLKDDPRADVMDIWKEISMVAKTVDPKADQTVSLKDNPRADVMDIWKETSMVA